MTGAYFSFALLTALAIALIVAAVTDLRRREIDNWLTAGIAIAAPLFWIATGLNWIDVGFQLGIAIVTFAVLAGLFAIGWMGGGDVKLLTALALWIKPLWFLKLIVVMAMVGGVLTLIFGALHLMGKRKGKVAIPYGIAISIAGLWVIASHYFPEFHQTGIIG